MNRLPTTLCVSILSAVIVFIISVPLGISAGVSKGSMMDFSMIFVVVSLQSMAVVWVCVLLLLIFSVCLKCLPSM